MNVIKTPLTDLFLANTQRFSDQRGGFARLFCEHDLAPYLGTRHIVQINHSSTASAGTVRGIHFQYPPHAEMKMIRCIKGKIFDVAVDLRPDSKQFLHWFGVILSPKDEKMMIIPEGFGHGFQSLEDNSELLYLHTAAYAPTHEGGVAWNDPRLNIDWVLPITHCSERDQQHPKIDSNFTGIML